MAWQRLTKGYCAWCSKKIYNTSPYVTDGGLKGFLSLGLLTKLFCSERCRTRYRQNKEK